MYIILQYYSAVSSVVMTQENEIVYSYTTVLLLSWLWTYSSLCRQICNEDRFFVTNGAEMENNQTADFDNNGMKGSIP